MANGSSSWPGQQTLVKGNAWMLEMVVLALHLLNRSPKLSGLRMALAPFLWKFSGKQIRGKKKHKKHPWKFSWGISVILLSTKVWFWESSSRHAWATRGRQKRNIVLGPCAIGKKIGWKVQIRCFSILFLSIRDSLKWCEKQHSLKSVRGRGQMVTPYKQAGFEFLELWSTEIFCCLLVNRDTIPLSWQQCDTACGCDIVT